MGFSSPWRDLVNVGTELDNSIDNGGLLLASCLGLLKAGLLRFTARFLRVNALFLRFNALGQLFARPIV